MVRRPSGASDCRLLRSCGSPNRRYIEGRYAAMRAFPVGPEYGKHAQIADARQRRGERVI
jgi:hypothetical protein